MVDKCNQCGADDPGHSETIIFNYQSLTVRIFKKSSECRDCAIREWSEEFEDLKDRGENQLFENRNGEIKIDWQVFKQLSYQNGSAFRQRVLELLVSLNVLSVVITGNWWFMNGGIVLNPMLGSSHLYFTKESDAIAYGKTEL